MKLAVKAAAADKTGEVIFNAKDQKAFGDAVVKAANEFLGSGSLTLSQETGNFSGGLKIKNGAIEVNNTLELLIDHSRSEMSAAVAKVLFG